MERIHPDSLTELRMLVLLHGKSHIIEAVKQIDRELRETYPTSYNTDRVTR